MRQSKSSRRTIQSDNGSEEQWTSMSFTITFDAVLPSAKEKSLIQTC